MRNPKTVYVIFENLIDQAIYCIVREMELGNHNPKFLIVLNRIKNFLDLAKEHLAENPSIQANNLAKKINDLYQEDKSVHAIHVRILFEENPDLSRTSSVDYKMY